MNLTKIARLGLAAALTSGLVACNNGSPLPEIGARNRASPALHTLDSCNALTTAMRQNLGEEVRVQLLSQQGYYYRGGLEAGVDDGANASGGGGGGGAPRQEGVDFSGTNNQEAGVDEADFVKMSHDGYHLFVLNGDRLEVLGVPTLGDVTREASVLIEGWPGQMLRGDDDLVVISTIYTYMLPAAHPLRLLVGDTVDEQGWWYRSTTLTKLTVVDVSDPTQPVVRRELYMDGWYQTAREVAGSVRTVTYSQLDVPGLQWWPTMPEQYWSAGLNDEGRAAIWQQAVAATIAHNDAVLATTPLESFLPRIYERFGGAAFAQHHFSEGDCKNFSIAEDGSGHGVTSILSLHLDGDALTFEHDHIVSNWSMVYASQDVMLIAEPAADWWWYWGNDDFDEATNIHRFDISVPGATTYTGSGRVDGTLGGQFALSEHEGTVRVASTTGQWGRWWEANPPPPENHIYTLGGDDALAQLGHVGGIAIGERLWSSRFVGDRAFLVTFRNIDPLWTVDLADPTAPAILGELATPGVSTYIHPLDGRLLTIGYGGDSAGLDWSTQVSLFDVGDFAAPALSDALSLAPPSPEDGWSYAWSEATWEHKAFQYWGPLGMLAIPLSTYRSVYDGSGDYGYTYEYYSRLQLIAVDTAGTGCVPSGSACLRLVGEVDHSAFFNSDNDVWWTSRDVRRAVFMHDAQAGRDFVYAISDRGVTATDLADMSLSASVTLPGQENAPYWWW